MAAFAPVRIEIARARAVSVPVAGELLAISEAEVRRMVRRGEIPTLRLGRRVLIPLAQLDVWIAEHHTAAAS